jgi:hypothetical protein
MSILENLFKIVSNTPNKNKLECLSLEKLHRLRECCSGTVFFLSELYDIYLFSAAPYRLQLELCRAQYIILLL